jgi:hypothetical protein
VGDAPKGESCRGRSFKRVPKKATGGRAAPSLEGVSGSAYFVGGVAQAAGMGSAAGSNFFNQMFR